jgi:hypothetical protein
MSIVRPTPPPAAAAAFASGIKAFLGGPDYGLGRNLTTEGYAGATPAIPTAADLGLVGGVDVNNIDAYHPLAVYRLDLNAAFNGLLSAATPAGWQFFVSKDHAAVMARVSRRPAPTVWKMTGCWYGPKPGETLMASLALDQLHETQKDKFTLRFLTIPGANASAFHLVSNSPSVPDLMVPYPTVVGPASNVTVMTAGGFLTALVPQVREAIDAPRQYGR